MHRINCSSAYTYLVYYSCLIFKLTRKQRFVADFLHSSHIQYDILCYRVILIAVLLGKDKIRTSHNINPPCAHCIASQPKNRGWARLSVFLVYSDQYELNCFVMIIPIT